MIDYLKLIVFPSRTLNIVDVKKNGFLLLYLIWLLAICSAFLPKYVALSLTSPLGYNYILIFLLIAFISYFPFVYGFSYLIWIIGKGLKGVSSYKQIRQLLIMSLIPSVLYFPFTITYIILGLVKNDINIISHINPISQIVLWILSFRILIVGIAKYNKFNWIISIFNWIIILIIISSFLFLIRLIK